jgi:hypothetical protein
MALPGDFVEATTSLDGMGFNNVTATILLACSRVETIACAKALLNGQSLLPGNWWSFVPIKMTALILLPRTTPTWLISS